MQIVIEIPDETYEKCKRIGDMNDTLFEAIRKGIVLPKNHGRLGDLDELEQRISSFVEHDAKITNEYTVTRQRFIVNGIRETSTIIEADNKSEE